MITCTYKYTYTHMHTVTHAHASTYGLCGLSLTICFLSSSDEQHDVLVNTEQCRRDKDKKLQPRKYNQTWKTGNSLKQKNRYTYPDVSHRLSNSRYHDSCSAHCGHCNCLIGQLRLILRSRRQQVLTQHTRSVLRLQYKIPQRISDAWTQLGQICETVNCYGQPLAGESCYSKAVCIAVGFDSLSYLRKAS